MAISMNAGPTTSTTTFTADNGKVKYVGQLSKGDLSQSISGSVQKADKYVGSFNFSLSFNTENVLTDEDKAAMLADVKEMINQL